VSPAEPTRDDRGTGLTGNQTQDTVALVDVIAADRRIAPYVQRTPLERSGHLSDLFDADVWLKLECFQLTGSFKLRGALNALLALDETARQRGGKPDRPPVCRRCAGDGFRRAGGPAPSGWL
jgi:Pyridoxal-phosphate dependent enzyme